MNIKMPSIPMKNNTSVRDFAEMTDQKTVALVEVTKPLMRSRYIVASHDDLLAKRDRNRKFRSRDKAYEFFDFQCWQLAKLSEATAAGVESRPYFAERTTVTQKTEPVTRPASA